MAFNGMGLFVRLYNWVQDRNNGIKILAARMDAEMDGFATGLSTCITKDGQQTVTADIPFNSHKITLLASPTLRTDGMNLAQAQDGTASYVSVTGSGTYIGSLNPAVSTTPDGMLVQVYFAKSNATTGTASLNLNGIGARNLVDASGSMLARNDIKNGMAQVISKGGMYYYSRPVNAQSRFGLPYGGILATAATAPLNTFFEVDCTGTAQTMPTDGSATAGDVMMFAKFGTNILTESLTNSQKFNGTTNNPVTPSEGVSTQVYTGASRGWVEG